jgi:hypothetical protein
MATTTTAASPTMALLRYRVSCFIIALLTVGITRLGVNPVVGAIVLLFETELLVGGGMGDTGKLADVAELVEGVELVDRAELSDGPELVGDIELVVVVVTMDNFSWPAVTV